MPAGMMHGLLKMITTASFATAVSRFRPCWGWWQAPVVYLGTFSKTLFPALRIGFMVMPPALAEAARRHWFAAARRPSGRTAGAGVVY
jgi:DNA-binding transcriptional MocR family regulator